MTCRRRRLALVGALVFGACALAGGARAVPSELRPLPELALEGVEEAIRGPLMERRAEVDRLIAGRRQGEVVDEERLAAALGVLGELYLVYDFSEAAEAALANAATVAPSLHRWPYLLGTLQQLERRWSEAEASFRRALELQPADGATLARLAEVVLEQERWQEADQLFARLEPIEGFGAFAAWGRGRAALGRGEPGAAVPYLERVLERRPDAGEVRYQLALAHRDAGDRERARALLAAPREGGVGFPDPVAVELRSSVRGVGALLVLGRQALEEGAPERAERRFREAVALDPTSVHAHQSLASLLRRQGRLEEALGFYEKALELDADLAGLRSFVAELYLARARSHWQAVDPGDGRPSLDQLDEPARGRARADLERAAAHLERTLGQAPEYVEGWLGLAEARAGLGDLAGAAAALGEGIERQPEQLELVVQLARLLAEQGRLDQAIAALDEASQRAGVQARLSFEAARMLEAAGRIGEAEQRFSSIAQTSAEPGMRGLAFFHLGNLAAAAGDLEGAITWYQNALAEDPALTTASFNLATLFGRLGRYGEAALHHGAVREREPDNHAARFGEALALALDGRHGEARRRLEQALERFPDGARYALLLARLLVASAEDEVRDGAVGLDLARRLMEAAPSLEHAETVAMGLAELGRFEEAVDWQSRVVETLEAGGEEVPAAVLEIARRRLEAYRAGQPWRAPIDPGATTAGPAP
ncbi:MAG TPA: tetratricopeptide repeat protein [Thermoanaerobaculia bacterium]|nr:tetratricopeptide repeat protein [Thermoanaerobaculia bacterium]